MIKSDVFPSINGVSIELISPGDITEEYSRNSCGAHSVLLKSGRCSAGHRFSIIGFHPYLVFRAFKNKILIYGKYNIETSGDPLKTFSLVLSRYSGVKFPAVLPVRPAAAGVFSYDLKDVIEDIPSCCSDAMHCPSIHFTFFRDFIIKDESTGAGFAVHVHADSQASGLPSGEFPKKPLASGFKSDFTEKEYKNAVKSVRHRIIEGEIYQANISQQFKASFGGGSLTLFKAIDKANPAPMSAFLDIGDFRIISSSPERFLLRKGSYAESRPIKGTRPRGASPNADKILKRELVESGKDKAELAMIVDLVRNDLAKSAVPGSVIVSERRRIEDYSNVFHSLAVVSASVSESLPAIELIKNCFPGGSVTGCPKVQAMKVIEETEKHKRGFYCGSIGYIGFDGSFDLNIAIRTFIQKGNTLFFNLGGGIVYDSDPEEEYDETMQKGLSMFSAVASSAAQA
jgi:para-aminobenzoate synthetase component I